MTDWQPIDSAPKDGTKILVYSSRNGQSDIIKWEDDAYEGHYESMIGYGGMTIPFLTHWMPLPEPPK